MLSAALLDANQASGDAGQSGELSRVALKGNAPKSDIPYKYHVSLETFEWHFKAMCVQCSSVPVGSAVTRNNCRLFWSFGGALTLTDGKVRLAAAQTSCKATS